MGFERPLLLVLVAAGPLYWWLRSRWHAGEMKRLRLFVRPALWEKVEIEPAPPRRLSRTLWAAGLSLSAVALAGPTWGSEAAVLQAGGGRNVVVALDVSASMASRDEVPSRLGRAAAAIGDMAEGLPEVRMGLVLFAGSPRLAVPLTMDREFLMSRVPTEPSAAGDLTPGTRLGDVVDMMIAALPGKELESNLGILISDGGFQDYSVQSAGRRASDAGLRLLTVGVGGPIEVPVPGGSGGPLVYQGDTVRTALEEEPLIALAEATGGSYMDLSASADPTASVAAYLEHLARRDAEVVTGGSTSARRYQYFLGAALLLMTAALLLERRDA